MSSEKWFIRGWANYHRHIVSKQVFVDIDRKIHWALWRWARRKHGQKSATWIRNTYFDEKGSGRTIFHTHAVNEEGAKVIIRLFTMASIPIRRHVKVKNAANPYDPTWELYYEQRQYNRVLADLADRPRLRHQWRLQRGICPVCGERITRETGWHNHHIHWRVYGGNDDLENRVLLHPNCHRQVHNPDYEGSPLRPSMAFERLERLAGKLARAVLRLCFTHKFRRKNASRKSGTTLQCGGGGKRTI